MGQVTAFDRVGWRRSSFRTGATSWAGNCIRRLRIIRTGIKQPCAPHRVRVVVASAAAQLYDVRRDQQLAGRAGQPDGSPFCSLSSDAKSSPLRRTIARFLYYCPRVLSVPYSCLCSCR